MKIILDVNIMQSLTKFTGTKNCRNEGLKYIHIIGGLIFATNGHNLLAYKPDNYSEQPEFRQLSGTFDIRNIDIKKALSIVFDTDLKQLTVIVKGINEPAWVYLSDDYSSLSGEIFSTWNKTRILHPKPLNNISLNPELLKPFGDDITMIFTGEELPIKIYFNDTKYQKQLFGLVMPIRKISDNMPIEFQAEAV